MEKYEMIYPVIGKEKNYPVYLSGIGRYPEYHIIRDKGLVSHQIHFTFSGEGVIKIDGKKFSAKRGSIFYVRPGVVHEYYGITDPWVTCWMVFRGELLDRMMENMEFGRYLFIENANIKKFQEQFDNILMQAGMNTVNSEKISVLVYKMIMMLKNEMSGISGKRMHNAVKAALRYIDENFEKDISINDLAGDSGISEQYFCRIFKNETDMRPVEYISRRRIIEAMKMLRTTDMPVAGIAEKTGFKSAAYFGMVFKKSEDMTPGQFRRLYKKDM